MKNDALNILRPKIGHVKRELPKKVIFLDLSVSQFCEFRVKLTSEMIFYWICTYILKLLLKSVRYVIKSIMKFDSAINYLQENFYNSRPNTQDTES